MRVIKGTSNRYLDIDLTTETWSVYTVTTEDLTSYLGGKGLALKIFYDRFAKEELAGIDPFGPENIIIFSMGVMLSSGASCTGRFEVLTKSPQTGLIVGSSCGGYFGEACKTAGWDGVIISGRAEGPLCLRIAKDGVQFEPAHHLWGQGTHEVQESLELTPKEGAAVIGPAGENRVLYANICSGHRFAGRGGIGAVMGAKNLKAIVARGKEVKYEPVLQKQFSDTVRKAKKYILRNQMSHRMRLYGTNANTRPGIQHGFSPVRNFRDRFHPDTEQISGEAMAEKYTTRHSTCRHCSILCGHKGHYPDGVFRQIPEYETAGMFGSNIHNFDSDLIGRWNEVLNELGMDTISAGGTIAWAMEAGEKGLRETELQFGRTDNIEAVLRQIASGKGAEAELAKGSKILSEQYGGQEFAIHVKGIEIAAYDPRAAWGQGLSYAVHNKGGCHLGSYLIGLEQLMGYMPPHTTLGKADWVIFMEDIYSGVNSLQLCQFTIYGILTEPVIPKYLPRFLLKIATITLPKIAMSLMNWSLLSRFFWSITGIRMNKWQFLKAGERINKLERWMDVQMGLKAADDTLPARFLKEKETAYTGKNTVVPIEKMVTQYHRKRGYDSTGGPSDGDLQKIMDTSRGKSRSITVRPSGRFFKTLYCRIVLAVLGWFIPAVACRKKSVQEEVVTFPEGFSFSLGVWPCGPSVTFRRRGRGLKKSGKTERVDMRVSLKSIEAAWLLFSFQESTCQSEANGRLSVEGELPHTCTFIRFMDKVEILLLPRFIAEKAVKKWVPVK
ncbi:aldehyde ferredoxin oxidoreductase family protein [Oceanispirochaeta crateris]|nr:aldehyde ferredoxin oxidoreductase family protein [Oceanispirochaeta crateris]